MPQRLSGHILIKFVFCVKELASRLLNRHGIAFQLTHIEKIPVAEAAEQLDVSPGAVYIARSRVMNRLRTLVHQFEDDHEHAMQRHTFDRLAAIR